MQESLRPEAFYKMENLEDVKIILNETAVVGRAIRFDTQKREVLVDLGYDFYGIIPESEVTIYDYTYSNYNDIPYQIMAVIGKQVRAIVTGFESDRKLKLSRILSMEQGWKNLEEDSNVIACVTRVWNNGIFIDVGNGLISYTCGREITGTFAEKMEEWFDIGENLKVRIVNKGNATNSKILASRRLAYSTLEENPGIINEGDIVAVRVGTRVNNEGYFCEVPPIFSGVLNANKELKNGQTVQAVVRKKGNKGLKLSHIEIL